KIINDIIDYLDKIDENHHFDITLEIFKFWKKKKKDGYNVFSNNQLNILRRTLKLKSLNSSYTEVSGYLIGDYYNGEDYISGILPSVNLDNQIFKDYHYTNSRKEDWKEFFKTVLNVSNPVEKQEIFEAKIKYWIDNQDSEKYQNDHYKIVREISDLYKDKDINNLTFRGNLF